MSSRLVGLLYDQAMLENRLARIRGSRAHTADVSTVTTQKPVEEKHVKTGIKDKSQVKSLK